ncbi:unnamed protein product [Ectocarpus sp. 12 AP-2014]
MQLREHSASVKSHAPTNVADGHHMPILTPDERLESPRQAASHTSSWASRTEMLLGGVLTLFWTHGHLIMLWMLQPIRMYNRPHPRIPPLACSVLLPRLFRNGRILHCHATKLRVLLELLPLAPALSVGSAAVRPAPAVQTLVVQPASRASSSPPPVASAKAFPSEQHPGGTSQSSWPPLQRHSSAPLSARLLRQTQVLREEIPSIAEPGSSTGARARKDALDAADAAAPEADIIHIQDKMDKLKPEQLDGVNRLPLGPDPDEFARFASSCQLVVAETLTKTDVKRYHKFYSTTWSADGFRCCANVSVLLSSKVNQPTVPPWNFFMPSSNR